MHEDTSDPREHEPDEQPAVAGSEAGPGAPGERIGQQDPASDGEDPSPS